MGQSKLSDLAILSIESELAKDTDFEEVINKVAVLKTSSDLVLKFAVLLINAILMH